MSKPMPVITQIMDYLLREYKIRLDLPDDHNEFARYFKEVTAGGDKTMRDLMSGKRNKPNKETCERLVTIFRPAIPRIKWTWFYSESLREFRERVQFAGGQVWLDVPVPHYGDSAKIAELAKRWCGTYLAYRHSFDATTADEVTCEVLHIWKGDDDPTIRFSMSFLPDPNGEPSFFGGNVLPLGRSLFFLAVNTNGAGGNQTGQDRGHDHLDGDRGRSLFVADARAIKGADNCKLAILSSTKLDNDCAPCAACTVLVKVQWQPQGLQEFTNYATRMSTYAEIIHADFGNQHDLWLKAFMDNIAAVPDGKTRRKNAPPEPVLRVDPRRFYEHMPSILEAVLADKDVYSPFKANWPNRASPSHSRKPALTAPRAQA